GSADAADPAAGWPLPPAVRRGEARARRDRGEVIAMVRVSRILKDYRDTGALNSLIALWGFVDDTTFLTKAGAVGVLYRLQGADFECLDHPQRHTLASRFEQALRQLDESFRVYEYVIKRPAPMVTAAPHRHPVVQE